MLRLPLSMRQICHPIAVIAVALCGLAIAGCTSDPATRKQAYYASGNKYFTEQKFAEARIEYQNAIEIDPKFAEARRKLGETYARLGDPNNAMREYVRAADLLPDDIEVQLQAGSYLLAANRAEEAKVRAETVTQPPAEQRAGAGAAGKCTSRSQRS